MIVRCLALEDEMNDAHDWTLMRDFLGTSTAEHYLDKNECTNDIDNIQPQGYGTKAILEMQLTPNHRHIALTQ